MKKGLCMSRVVALVVIAIFLIPAVLTAETKNIEYTVKKGDTLWTISSSQMKDSSQWRKLWKANKYVRNPNMIYPDQVLIIPDKLSKAGKRAGKKLIPVTARNLPASYGKPLVSNDTLLFAGYFTRRFVPVGKIEGSRFPGETSLLGKEDFVHVVAGTKLIPDTKYYICRPVETILNPGGKNKVVGYLVRIKGALQIIGEENGNTKAKIIDSYKEISSGDMIVNYFDFMPPYAPVVERRPSLSGTIVVVDDTRSYAGKDYVVHIDKGSMHGVEIGDTFKISDGKPPHAIVGSLQVFSVFDEASAAVVKKTEREVMLGDTFGN